MGDSLPEPLDPVTGDKEFDRRFAASWQSELLARACDALAHWQERTGQPYHTVLRLRVDHPAIDSPALAERLTALLGRTISGGALRMLLQSSRDCFGEFLLEEVKGSLISPTAENVEQELIDLGLQTYCRSYLKRHGHSH